MRRVAPWAARVGKVLSAASVGNLSKPARTTGTGWLSSLDCLNFPATAASPEEMVLSVAGAHENCGREGQPAAILLTFLEVRPVAPVFSTLRPVPEIVSHTKTLALVRKGFAVSEAARCGRATPLPSRLRGAAPVGPQHAVAKGYGGPR
jgi:hypothetical protein